VDEEARDHPTNSTNSNRQNVLPTMNQELLPPKLLILKEQQSK
jgi:hypothetical protein